MLSDSEWARLFQVIADGYKKRSLIITTNVEVSRWGTVFGDDNMAAAVIDHGRVHRNAHLSSSWRRNRPQKPAAGTAVLNWPETVLTWEVSEH